MIRALLLEGEYILANTAGEDQAEEKVLIHRCYHSLVDTSLRKTTEKGFTLVVDAYMMFDAENKYREVTDKDFSKVTVLIVIGFGFTRNLNTDFFGKFGKLRGLYMDNAFYKAQGDELHDCISAATQTNPHLISVCLVRCAQRVLTEKLILLLRTQAESNRPIQLSLHDTNIPESYSQQLLDLKLITEKKCKIYGVVLAKWISGDANSIADKIAILLKEVSAENVASIYKATLSFVSKKNPKLLLTLKNSWRIFEELSNAPQPLATTFSFRR